MVFMTGFIGHNSIESIVNGLVFLGVLLTNWIIIIQSYVTRHKQLNIIENILTVDDIMLKKLGKYLKYTDQRQRLTQKVFGLLFFVVFMLMISNILMILRNFDILLLVQLNYPLLLIRVRCIQIIFYADILHDRLKIISDILVHAINYEREVHESSIKIILCLREEITNNIMDNSMDYVELVSLKKIYSILWNINCLMNDCFGWSLLLICIQYFVQLTTNCYYLYLIVSSELIYNEQYSALCDISAIVSILWLLCNGCQKYTKTVCFFIKNLHISILFTILYIIYRL